MIWDALQISLELNFTNLDWKLSKLQIFIETGFPGDCTLNTGFPTILNLLYNYNLRGFLLKEQESFDAFSTHLVDFFKNVSQFSQFQTILYQRIIMQYQSFCTFKMDADVEKQENNYFSIKFSSSLILQRVIGLDFPSFKLIF